MKSKFLFASLLASALTMSAQGYKDGVEYYKADQFADAKILLERNLHDASTDKAVTYFYLGAIDVANKDYASAKANFDNGIAANSNNAYNYIGLGRLALVNGDEKAAEDYFKQATSINKKDAKVYVLIARNYYKVDAVKYAKQIDKNIEQAIKANKKDPEICMYRGDVKADEKDWGGAAGEYENAILFQDNLPEAYVKYANTYFNVNPQFAIQKLEEYLAKYPNSALAQRELAEKYYENDQLTKAAEQYGKYIQNPNHFKKDEIRYVALLYFGKKYNESDALAKKLLAEDPSNFYMQRMVFLNQAALGNNEEAKVAAEKFFANGKGEYVANDYTTYGEVLQALGDNESAAAQYEKAVEINPNKIELLKDLSSAYNKAKMYDKSAEAFQRFVDKGDYVTNDLFTLSGRYMTAAATSTDSIARAASVENALKYVDIVLEKVPDNFRIQQRKARILLTKNNNVHVQEVANAYKATVDVLDQNPDNKTSQADAYKEAYNSIGSYYLTQNDFANALTWYEKFLVIDPTNTALGEFVAKLREKASK